eukprot:340523-Pleurochrysis_carterae.AAC.4
MMLCKKAPRDWSGLWTMSLRSAAERFVRLARVVRVMCEWWCLRMTNRLTKKMMFASSNRHHFYAARHRKGRWEYQVIWKGYPDSTWETAAPLATAVRRCKQ